MTNPLKEDYKKGNRWCERGLENLGKRERERERESDMREEKREK